MILERGMFVHEKIVFSRIRIDILVCQMDYVLDPIKLARLDVQLQYNRGYGPSNWITVVLFYWLISMEEEKLN